MRRNQKEPEKEVDQPLFVMPFVSAAEPPKTIRLKVLRAFDYTYDGQPCHVPDKAVGKVYDFPRAVGLYLIERYSTVAISGKDPTLSGSFVASVEEV